MKLSPRIYIPAGLALAIGIGVGGLFLWQIHQSVTTIETSFKLQGNGNALRKFLPTGNAPYPDSTTQSQALMQLRQGEVFELRGEWKQAQEKYEESAVSGGGAPALRKLAAIQLQRREYDDAALTISALKRETPNGNDIMFLEGILALRQNNLSTATSIFNRKPESPQGMYGLALVAVASNNHEEAKQLFEKAKESDDPGIRNVAGIVLQAYNDFALFPQGQLTHRSTLVARALAQVNECETALKLVFPVVLAEPSYRDGWIVKGFCEFNTERPKDALASLEQAYALDPEKPEIQYFLARTHATLGDPQNAVTFLQYAILNGFEPERDARELLADYALELGNTSLALEQYKIIADGKKGDLSAYRRYIDLAITTPNHSLDALSLAKTALTRWPDDAATFTLAAKAALAAGIPKEAQTYIESALRIDPKNPDAQLVQEAIRKAGTLKQ